MKLSHIIPGALLASGLMLTPTKTSQEDTAMKVKQICDKDGNYLNPPTIRDSRMESAICISEKQVQEKERSIQSREFRIADVEKNNQKLDDE